MPSIGACQAGVNMDRLNFNRKYNNILRISKNNRLYIIKHVLMAVKSLKIHNHKKQRKNIAVIGGGVFGILSALEIAKKGYEVHIFEKNKDILLEASLVNQCRIHMGYHYPRDKETARATLNAKDLFCKTFPEAVVKKNFENYYCLAKEGSRVSPNEYIEFCNDIGLPVNVGWPGKIDISKDKINFCLRVPEKIFDNNTIKKSCIFL